jgi:hypothetical protein
MVSSWAVIGRIFGTVFDPWRSADVPANAIQLVDTCSDVHGVSRGLLGDEAGQFSRALSFLFMAAAAFIRRVFHRHPRITGGLLGVYQLPHLAVQARATRPSQRHEVCAHRVANPEAGTSSAKIVSVDYGKHGNDE